MDIEKTCEKLRCGNERLAVQNAAQKSKALAAVYEAIQKNRAAILAANKTDVDAARAKGMTESLVERLALDDKKIDGMLESIKIIIAQTDPIGEEIAGWKTPGGITIRQVRVPLGIVAIIYESRPNVTVDAFCLAYKSGNAILLRGSSSAINSNRVLVDVIKEGLEALAAEGCGVSDAIALAPCESHDEVDQILTAVGKIDVALPRGGAKLINTVVEKAKVPVIQTGAGVCHLYVDEGADIEVAADIAYNAKTQRPGACNAIECILVNAAEAERFLPVLAERFAGKVEIRADEAAFALLARAGCVGANGAAAGGVPSASGNVPFSGAESGRGKITRAGEADFGYEFLDFVCAVKVVGGVEEAISFINAHNTKHSECIVTNNRANARLFQQKVDAACVYVNASTRFTDGGEFGFGAELGISTQKLHARGPMGIKALTTTKYLIDGEGQVRE